MPLVLNRISEGYPPGRCFIHGKSLNERTTYRAQANLWWPLETCYGEESDALSFTPHRLQYYVAVLRLRSAIVDMASRGISPG